MSTPFVRQLRNHMTKEERRLWYEFLKDLPLTVRRQKAIGSYIVDFYIASAKTVIELDGGQHYEPEKQRQDAQRDAYLRQRGLQVLRYSNREVNQQFRAVCEDICRKIGLLEDDTPWEP